MKHLEIFKVAFIGSVAREFEGRKYYQNAFELNGNLCQAKAAEDYSGKCGYVQFLQKGQELNGKTITSDCFSLKFCTDAEKVKSAKQALNELMAA